MKKNLQILLILVALIQFSFSGKLVCEQVNSSLGFAEKQAVKAQKSNSINLLKYNTFKAINTLQKLDKQLETCGCESASHSVKNGLTYLKNATKTTSIDNAKELLKYAKKEIDGGIEAITSFNSEKNRHTTEPVGITNSIKADLLEDMSYPTIDSLLSNFKQSMLVVLQTTDCGKAKEFTNEIYEDCVKNLLDTTLPKAKAYHYIKTKEIAEEFLLSLRDCDK